jgi:nitrate/TMAO reductase-like tetraheme cytochrome c subunit
MDFHKQTPRAREKMEEAMQKGVTCIECHKGIAHRLPPRDD